jgi:hypothetical protein
MDKLSTIAEGFKNLALNEIGLPNDKAEELAEAREVICNSCFKDGNPVLVEGRCTLCNCIMQAKWRAVNAVCPLKKW